MVKEGCVAQWGKERANDGKRVRGRGRRGATEQGLEGMRC